MVPSRVLYNLATGGIIGALHAACRKRRHLALTRGMVFTSKLYNLSSPLCTTLLTNPHPITTCIIPPTNPYPLHNQIAHPPAPPPYGAPSKTNKITVSTIPPHTARQRKALSLATASHPLPRNPPTPPEPPHPTTTPTTRISPTRSAHPSQTHHLPRKHPCPRRGLVSAPCTELRTPLAVYDASARLAASGCALR